MEPTEDEMAASGKIPPTRSPKKKLKRDERALELKKMNKLIESLRGSCKGGDSFIDALHEMRQEKSFSERRWEK
jgi:hypothetical protein